MNYLGSTLQIMSTMINDGKGGFILVGLLSYFVDLIDFINIATLYIFINMTKPGNLEGVFQALSDSMQISPLPFLSFDPPFSEYEDIFVRPAIYEHEDLSFNFASHFIMFISQLIIFLMVNKGLKILSKKIGINKIG